MYGLTSAAFGSCGGTRAFIQMGSRRSPLVTNQNERHTLGGVNVAAHCKADDAAIQDLALHYRLGRALTSLGARPNGQKAWRLVREQ